MIVDLIFIHKKDFSKVKIKIYYQTIEVITKCNANCIVLEKIIQLNIIVLEKTAVKSLLIMCKDKNL